MIAIVDYGLGNTLAIANIYKHLNIDAALVSNADALRRADRFILPGVGSFDWALQSLERAGLRQTLDELVRIERRPVLGICVGMHMMARSSEEGIELGLGWLDADVRRLPQNKCLMLPHMGWNDVALRRDSRLTRGLEKEARFYFLHSYYFVPRADHAVIAEAEYGQRFACAVQSENIFGVQFHPEKSHGWGMQLLRNFAEA